MERSYQPKYGIFKCKINRIVMENENWVHWKYFLENYPGAWIKGAKEIYQLNCGYSKVLVLENKIN